MNKILDARYGELPFAETHTRRSDPSTSYRSARRAEYRAGSHKAKILETMRNRPPMNWEEIARIAGMKDSQVWKRLPDLEKDGMVIPMVEERKTSTGSPARLWKLADG